MRRMADQTLALLAIAVLSAGSAAAAPAAPLLLQNPTLSRDTIAFDYGGQIWSVPRTGGPATRVVSGQGRNSGPVFSPDGSLIAYTGTYDQNADVYVVPAAGGQPRRLTYHPGPDEVIGWRPD